MTKAEFAAWIKKEFNARFKASPDLNSGPWKGYKPK